MGAHLTTTLFFFFSGWEVINIYNPHLTISWIHTWSHKVKENHLISRFKICGNVHLLRDQVGKPLVFLYKGLWWWIFLSQHLCPWSAFWWRSCWPHQHHNSRNWTEIQIFSAIQLLSKNLHTGKKDLLLWSGNEQRENEIRSFPRKQIAKHEWPPPQYFSLLRKKERE